MVGWNNVVDLISQNPLLSTGLLLSSFVTFLIGYAKKLMGIPSWLWGRLARQFFFSVEIGESSGLMLYTDIWMAHNHGKSIRSVEVNKVTGKLIYSHRNDYVRVWRNGRLITISKEREKLEHASSSDNRFSRSYTVSGIFARKEILKLIEEISSEGELLYDELRAVEKGVRLISIDPYGRGHDIGRLIRGKEFEKISLPKVMGSEMLEDLDWFLDSEAKFIEKGMGYKRGYLLHGEPGNGKSSVAYAIAKKLGYNIFILDLAVEGSFASSILRRVPEKTVVVIEDIDNFFNKRETVGESKVNFSTFINALSGVAQTNGIFTVITTNKFESVDPALLRAGRADKIFRLDNPNKEEAEDFVENWFDEKVELSNYTPMCYANLQDLIITSKTKEEFLNKYNSR